MHDLLEGVLQYEIKELLNHLIDEDLLTLYEINSRLEYFPYSYNDIKDKPTSISSTTLMSSDHSLKQKGNINISVCITKYMSCQFSCTNVVPSQIITYNNR